MANRHGHWSMMRNLLHEKCKRARLPVLLVLAGFAFGASMIQSHSSYGADAEDPSGPVEWAPETFTLGNGMDVVVLPDHRVPVVTHMVWYRVGAADEPPLKSGIAHFLEHLMFKGTDNVPPGELSKIVARNGGQDNAFTSQDYTAYFQRVALDRLPLVMELEADRMTNLVLSDKVVNPERDVVLEERSSRTDNNPESILNEQMGAALFMAHPYRVPIIGWEHEIKNLNTDDAITFYKKHYAPNNAILIVAGDITAEQLRPLAEEYYGVIPAGEVTPRVRGAEPPSAAPRRIEYFDPRVQQATLRRFYVVPSYAQAEPGQAEALDLLSQILGTGSTSRLYRELVVTRALAASAGSWYSGSALDYARFAFYAAPREGVDLTQLEAAIDEVLAEIAQKGVSSEELERAKSNTMADVIYARDNQRSMAQAFGVALTTGGTIEDVLSYPDRINKVTAEDVQKAAQSIVDNQAHVTGYMRSEPAEQ